MKKVLITGASRGIGKAIAQKFIGEYELFLISRNHPELISEYLEEHLQSMKSDHMDSDGISFGNMPSVRIYVGDVGDYEFIKEVFGDIGSLDILINNAGMASFGLIQDTSPNEWDKVIRTDLTSIYNTCHFASKLMISQHDGRIINVSSMWGISGASCESAYSAAKGGVNAFTRALAKELAPSGIAVNAIAPGVIDTDMNKHLSDDESKALMEQIPAGRIGTPEEVAEAVYLLSKMPTYLTGQIIAIDGGFL